MPRCIDAWERSDRLSERQRTILRTLAGKLRSSRGTGPMSPWEWEQFWAIRDYLMPDPQGPAGRMQPIDWAKFPAIAATAAKAR